MNRRPRAVTARFAFAVCISGAAAVWVTACGDGDENAKPRTGDNGCVSEGCYDAAASSSGTTSSGSSGASSGSSGTSSSGTSGSSGTDAGDGGSDAQAPIDPLPANKNATLVKNGFMFTEGPVWIGGKLLFSDTNANTIYELQGTNAVAFRTNSGGGNGNAVDQNGKLITCEGGGKRVVRADAVAMAATTPIATTFNNAALNSPNDVIVRKDGNIYFTDPNYSGQANTQDDEAVYRINPQGAVTRIAQDFNKPNGIALSPGGGRIYVVDNGAGTLLAAQVQANGDIAANSFTKIADVPGGDGMAVDDNQNLYVAANGGVQVFDKTGKKLGTITVAEKPSNCTFGGGDRKTLYITAVTGLYSIGLNVPGLP